MTPHIKKWVLKPLLILLVSATVLTTLGVLLLLMEQDRVVHYAVEELNKKFKGELTVEESSISPFKHFPYVSVALHEARFYGDKNVHGQPILSLEKLYVGLSLTDLLHRKYNFRRLSFYGGYLNIVQEADGTLNILEAEHFQSDSGKTKTDTTNVEFVLQKMVIKDVTVSYLDRISGRKVTSKIDQLTSSFTLHHKVLAMEIDGDLVLSLKSLTDSAFFHNKKIKLDLKGDYKTDIRQVDIASGAITLQEAAFNVSGSASFNKINFVDLKIKGDKPDIKLIAAFLPGDVKEKLKPFKYDGVLYFDGYVKGEVSKNEMPMIDVSFGCENAWLLNTGADKKVDQLGFRGYYTNGYRHSLATSELRITNVSARPEKGVFKGNFVLRDFTDPHTLIQINSELELKFLGDFLGIPDLQQFTGKIKLDMNFKELNGIALPEQSLNKLKEGIQSKLRVEGLSFTIPGYPYAIRDMNLQAEMKDGRVTVDSAFLRIGESDLRFSGSLSDIQGFLHDRKKVITLALQASSRKIVIRDLFASDTARYRRIKEEVNGFNIGLILETSVEQLLNPAPLPKGKLEIKNLRASFKRYPHAFKDLGATVTINDTALLVRNFAGMVDKSDFKFSGRVIRYQLWFDKVKKGKTQVAFDLKSTRFAMEDFLGPRSSKFIPAGYRKEEASNLWLRAKIDLRYDTIFRFAKAHIANITGDLKLHNLKVKDITGTIKYGTNRVLVLDTLKGMIGRSDFDITLHLFAGLDKKMKKRTNYLNFHSNFLDIDEISHYDLASADPSDTPPTKDTSKHARAFNIFMIPFIDFKAEVDIGKIKYEKLWLKEVKAKLRMQEDHFIYLDTVGMRVADGTVGVKGHLNGSNPAQIFFNSTINVEQIDLEKMMLKLDHFGQDVAINKNLKGRLSGQIVSEVLVHPNLVPQVSKTRAEMNVKIYNGSLNDFAPMQAMASYFKDKNLRLVRFDTLQNKLTFTNGVLKIPSMNINSSLGYIQMSGKQSVDLTMEYYVRVPMKMVTKVGFNALFDRKAEDVDVKQIDEIEYSEKDKKIRFMNLKVTGTPEDFKVGLGKDKSKN